MVKLRPNVNHTNLPIELTVSKRRKLVGEMCDSMKAELDREVRTEAWHSLCALRSDTGATAKEQLEVCLAGLAEHEPEWYNEDANLSAALAKAVDAKTAVSCWPAGLAMLQEKCEQPSLASLFGVASATVQAARGAKPIGREGAYGACALLALGSELQELSLPGNQLGATGAEALGRILKSNTTLHTLCLDGSQFASNVGTDGAVFICAALETNATLTKLSLADNRLDGKDATLKTALKAVLQKNTSLIELNLRFNRTLGWAGADAVLEAKSPLRRLNLLNTFVGVDKARKLATLDVVTLCGLADSQTEFKAPNKALDSGDAILLAADIRRNRSLKVVDISSNQIGDDAEEALVEAFRTSTSLSSLVLSGNAFSAEAKERLRQAGATVQVQVQVD